MNTTAGLKVVSERLSAVWRAALRSEEENKRAFSVSSSFSGGGVGRLEGNRDWSLLRGEIIETRFFERVYDFRAGGCVCVCVFV